MKNVIFILSVLLTTPFSMATENVYNYRCFSYLVDGEKNTNETMSLSVSKQTARGNILNETWDDNLIGGDLDPHYKPRTTGSIKFLKYGTLIIEESLAEGGRRLNDGSLGGLARFEAVIEGSFTQFKFVCQR